MVHDTTGDARLEKQNFSVPLAFCKSCSNEADDYDSCFNNNDQNNFLPPLVSRINWRPMCAIVKVLLLIAFHCTSV